jgi:hypothetical protein
MEAVRESWTDERLDDFRAETARRFGDVDRRFDEVDRRFDAMDRRFDALDKRIEDRFNGIDQRFDALQRTMLQFGGGVIIALLVAFLGVVASQL